MTSINFVNRDNFMQKDAKATSNKTFGAFLSARWMMSRFLAVLILCIVPIALASCGSPKASQQTTVAGPSSSAPGPLAAPKGDAPIKSGDVLEMDIGDGVRLAMVYISPGEFDMGSLDSELFFGKHPTDEFRHHVVLARGFWIGKFSVTQRQYHAVMGENPSEFKGEGLLPVERVSWDDAVKFCRKLSDTTGRKFRLPTEAEWEYACRAGTETEYNTGNGEASLAAAGWYGYDAGNSGEKTHPVGQKKPNAWGLYDMHGNVAEWCEDAYDADYYHRPDAGRDPRGPKPTPAAPRVIRGGSWFSYASECRSASRNAWKPDFRNYALGFRVCMDVR
ncbi:MAG TPA: formylglycine-generating enzyme family protein [Tepidisphaeraceae bacterium]|nr:formylglycine-generating enzyme family protein [Tepidisphaeraceae bacterium]